MCDTAASLREQRESGNRGKVSRMASVGAQHAAPQLGKFERFAQVWVFLSQRMFGSNC
jgi:hypothetical protein